MLADMNVQKFLGELASASPAPGGGAAAALAAAASASLMAMVCNLTIGKEKYLAVEGEARRILGAAEQLRTRLTRLMDEDAAAFDAVIRAYRLPKTTEEEKAARGLAIQQALRHASQVPLECANLAMEVLLLSEGLVKIGNPQAISDVGMGVLLGESAVWGALLNVEINARQIKDAALAEELLAKCARLRERSSAVRTVVLAAVHEKL